MADITVIGSNMVDLTTYIERMPVDGETVEAPSFEMGFGGKGANQAIAAARLGSAVNFITMVGHDSFGEKQQLNYRQNDINMAGVSVGQQASGVAPIFVDAQSSNRIIIVKGANQELTPTVLDQKIDLIKNSKLIVLQQEIALETNYHAIQLATKYHIPVLLNPAPANKDLDLNKVKQVDFFTPNETELASLTGLPTSNLDQIKIAAHQLLDQGIKNVIVTLGSHGVFWASPEHEQSIPAVRVNATDTTGAGDAFIGSFAHYYVKEQNVAKALQQASQYAAVTVMKKGTQKSYPTAAELTKLIVALR